MIKAFRRLCTFGALLSLGTLAASAQTTAPTASDKFFAHFDLGISGSGEFTPNTSGNTYLPQSVQLSPSNTLGALVELRYTVSPKIGLQYNYSYARYVDNFTINNTTGTPINQVPYIVGVQTKVTEYTVGYVGHIPNYFGLHPFVGAGGGLLAFRPTKGGGQGVQNQVRGAIYYAVGVEDTVFSEHFGLRVQFRQLYFGAPDFNENYLANGQRSHTTQPTAGFFLRF